MSIQEATEIDAHVLRRFRDAEAFFNIGLSSRLLLVTLSSSCFLVGREGASAIRKKQT